MKKIKKSTTGRGRARLVVYIPPHLKDFLQCEADKKYLSLSHHIFSLLLNHADSKNKK